MSPKKRLGRYPGTLVGMKSAAQYGSRILSEQDRITALRAARNLVTAAKDKTT